MSIPSHAPNSTLRVAQSSFSIPLFPIALFLFLFWRCGIKLRTFQVFLRVFTSLFTVVAMLYSLLKPRFSFAAGTSAALLLLLIPD
jgi:hypothetical protein